MGDLFLFAQTDLVRNNPPVSAGGRITAHPRWSRVRRKWVQPEASQIPPTPRGGGGYVSSSTSGRWIADPKGPEFVTGRKHNHDDNDDPR